MNALNRFVLFLLSGRGGGGAGGWLWRLLPALVVGVLVVMAISFLVSALKLLLPVAIIVAVLWRWPGILVALRRLWRAVRRGFAAQRPRFEQAKAQAQTPAQRSFEQAQRRFDAVRRRWPWHASSAASERDTVQDVVWRDLPPR